MERGRLRLVIKRVISNNLCRTAYLSGDSRPPLAFVASILDLHSHGHGHLDSFPGRSHNQVWIAAVIIFDDAVFVRFAYRFVDRHVLVVIPWSVAIISGRGR